jgi:hypothetical protein
MYETRSVGRPTWSTTIQLNVTSRLGGILLLEDGSIYIWNEHKEVMAGVREGQSTQNRSWFARWGEEVRVALGSKVDYPFSERVAHLEDKGDFEYVRFQEHYAPIGWDGYDADHGEEVGQIMVKNSLVCRHRLGGDVN